MDKYESQVKGTPITYTADGIQFGNNVLAFADMSDIALRAGENPSWTFVYQGRNMQVPYDISEKDYIEPFIEQAMQKSSGDLSDLIQPAQEESDVKTTAAAANSSNPEPEVPADNGKKGRKKAKEKKGKTKTKICKHCGAEIAKSAKVCPHCGGKNKKPIYKRVSLYVILAVILVLILIIAGSGNQYKLSDDASSMSASDYKAACSEVAYKDLAKNIDKYQGEKFKFTGQVQQVVLDSESGESEYLVAVTKDEYDFYDDNIYLYYEVGDSEKIIEEDIITIYGEASGEESYTSVLGEDITIPAVTAVYVDVEK